MEAKEVAKILTKIEEVDQIRCQIFLIEKKKKVMAD